MLEDIKSVLLIELLPFFRDSLYTVLPLIPDYPEALYFAQVRLVVVDSVASPFRHGFTDMGMRNRILSGMAQNLIKMATLHDIAVSVV